MSQSIHVYISQSDKGEMVFGGDLDHYPPMPSAAICRIASRTVAAQAHRASSRVRRLRMLRHWAGTTDMSFDGSPIIGATPVDGLYLNCGWCSGGFKATPGSAAGSTPTSGDRVARTRSPRPSPSTASRAARLIDEAAPAPPRRRGKGAGAMLLIACPHCGPRGDMEFAYERRRWTRSCRSMRRPRRRREYLYQRGNPAGFHDERWRHTHGCRAWLRLARDTATHEIAAVVPWPDRHDPAVPPCLRRPDRPHADDLRSRSTGGG